jgi:hypothetical protein
MELNDFFLFEKTRLQSGLASRTLKRSYRIRRHGINKQTAALYRSFYLPD